MGCSPREEELALNSPSLKPKGDITHLPVNHPSCHGFPVGCTCRDALFVQGEQKLWALSFRLPILSIHTTWEHVGYGNSQARPPSCIPRAGQRLDPSGAAGGASDSQAKDSQARASQHACRRHHTPKFEVALASGFVSEGQTQAFILQECWFLVKEARRFWVPLGNRKRNKSRSPNVWWPGCQWAMRDSPGPGPGLLFPTGDIVGQGDRVRSLLKDLDAVGRC